MKVTNLILFTYIQYDLQKVVCKFIILYARIKSCMQIMHQTLKLTIKVKIKYSKAEQTEGLPKMLLVSVPLV